MVTKRKIKTMGKNKRVTIGDVSADLGPEEYSAFQGKAGLVSDRVKQLQTANEDARLRDKVIKDMAIEKKTEQYRKEEGFNQLTQEQKDAILKREADKKKASETLMSKGNKETPQTLQTLQTLQTQQGQPQTLDNQVFNSKGELVSGERGPFTGTNEGTINRQLGLGLATGGASLGALATTPTTVQATAPIITTTAKTAVNSKTATALYTLIATQVYGFGKGEARDKTGEIGESFRQSKMNAKDIIKFAKTDPDPLQAVDDYYAEIENMRRLRDSVRLMNKTWIGRKLFNSEELEIEIENFLSDRTQRRYQQRLNDAIMGVNTGELDAFLADQAQ
jgi:hypothetical protein